MSDNSDIRIGVGLAHDDHTRLRELAQARSLPLATYCRMILVDHARGQEVSIPEPPSKKRAPLKAV